MGWWRAWRVVVSLWAVLLAPPTIPAFLQEDGPCSSGPGGGGPSEQGWQLQAQAGAVMTNPLRFKFCPAAHLRVAAESWPPHVQVVRGQGGHLKVLGPMANFLDLMATSMNFTYSIIQGDGYWGAPQDNGSWNGMIGMLLRKEADLGLGPFGLTHPRSLVVDFTTPIFREVLHLLLTRPRPNPNPWGFLAPFTWGVWVGVVAGLVVLAVTGGAVVKLLGYGGPSTLTQHLWTHYQIFLSQSVPWVPQGLALRLTFWLSMVAALVIMRTYSGSLTSLLAVKTVPIKYDSLRDALDDPGLTLLMEGSTALTAHLERAGEGLYGELAQAVAQRGVQVRASQLQEEAYTRLPDGRHAMFLERIGCNKVYSDHFSKTGRCDFYMTRGVFWPLLYSLAVPRASPLRPLIDSRIVTVRGFGIYGVWAGGQTPNLTHCLRMPTKLKFHEPYTMIHLWALFLLLAGGMLLATSVFLAELLLGRCVTAVRLMS